MRTNRKKWFSVMLAAALCLTSVQVPALAEGLSGMESVLVVEGVSDGELMLLSDEELTDTDQLAENVTAELEGAEEAGWADDGAGLYDADAVPGAPADTAADIMLDPAANAASDILTDMAAGDRMISDGLVIEAISIVPDMEVSDEAGTLQTAAAPVTVSRTYINPLYSDVISEADLKQPDSEGISLAAVTDPVYGTVEQAADHLRSQMKERAKTITTGIWLEYLPDQNNLEYEVDNLVWTIMDPAMVHTGMPAEGDYLMTHLAGYQVQAEIGSEPTADRYPCQLTFTVTYYTTAEQEAQVDAAVANLVSELGLSSNTDSNYVKIKKIYDYICANVKYDDANLNNEAYTLKFSAYAALMNKTAVCQGYASLFYRLALECGIDARVITGYANNGPHAWNIVRIGNYYYNLDATWDAGQTEYSYFLECDADFTDNGTDHFRDENYDAEHFRSDYPVPSKSYVPEPGIDFHTHTPGEPVKENEVAAACLTDGSYDQVIYCTDTSCGAEISREKVTVPAGGHVPKDEPEEISRQPATCVADGWVVLGLFCGVEGCGEEIGRESAVLNARGYHQGEWIDTSEITNGWLHQKKVCPDCFTEETRKVLISPDKTSITLAVDGSTTVKIRHLESDGIASVTSSDTNIAEVSDIQTTAESSTGNVNSNGTRTVNGTRAAAAGVGINATNTSVNVNLNLDELLKDAIQVSYTTATGTLIDEGNEEEGIDSSFKITATGSGTAQVTVTLRSGAKCVVNVTASVPEEDGEKVENATVKLNATSIKLQKGKTTTALKIVKTSVKGDKLSSAKSSNPKVVKVNKKMLKITAVKEGTAVITVKMKSGATAKAKVTVQKGTVTTKKLTFDKRTVTVKVGKKVTLEVTRDPITATGKITFKSSNTKIATVNQKGKVTAKMAGKAKITAVSANGKKATCIVTVKK